MTTYVLGKKFRYLRRLRRFRPSAPTPASSREWGYGARPRGPRAATLARPSGGSAYARGEVERNLYGCFEEVVRGSIFIAR
jgi:hypothetical protein